MYLSPYIYIYIYIYILYIHTYVCMYIYIYRERERDKDMTHIVCICNQDRRGPRLVPALGLRPGRSSASSAAALLVCTNPSACEASVPHIMFLNADPARREVVRT